MKNYSVGIIGCSGFIAGQLLQAFAEKEMSVVGFSRAKPTQKVSHFVPYDLTQMSESRVEPIQVETLIFNAGLKGRFDSNNPLYKTQGLVTAPSLDDLCQRMNLSCHRILTIGSSEEYGPRTSDEEIPEEAEPTPISSYGFWKSRLHQNLLDWTALNKKQGLHLRPFNVIGPGQDPQMFLASLLETLLRGQKFSMTAGEQWRSFIAVKTLVTAVTKILSLEDWGFGGDSKALNVSEPHYYQIREVAARIQALVGRGTLDIGGQAYREAEVWHQRPQLKKMEQLLGENYASDFTEDIREIIQGYQGRRTE